MDLGATLRILHPAPNVLAYWDGRIPGVRAWSEEPNWLDDGAFSLGVASYALVDGDEALVYDTHISPAHAARIRADLDARGVRRITVVLSHWHTDHVAGNAVFADCAIVARRRTAELMAENRDSLVHGTPPIDPLVMPTRLLDAEETLSVGGLTVELRFADIHSEDELLLFLPDRGLLFAGDALEDPLTYVDEPHRLAMHRADLDRIAAWPVRRILPNHGDPDVIAAGGHGPGLIAATARYVDHLLALSGDPARAAMEPEAVLAQDLAAGTIGWWEDYRAVHRHNVEAVLAAAGGRSPGVSP